MDANTPTVSVILTTCAAPQHLEQVLLGYSRQQSTRFEIVVAEDGRDERTERVLERMRPLLPGLHHVWQEHRGFRKTRILNAAIRAARGEYLIFSDGDCVPRHDFVSAHLRAARPARFLSGGRVCLSAELTTRLATRDIVTGNVHSASWLAAQGLQLAAKWKWLESHPRLASALDQLTPTRPTFNGHNASAWKHDVIRVNGFDERMGYGGLDRELGERLENAGIRGVQLRHRAWCVHLEHPRGYISPDVVKKNKAIRMLTRRERRTWTEYGLKWTAPALASAAAGPEPSGRQALCVEI